MMKNDITKDWALYEAGKKYNNKIKPSYYDTVDANLAFYQGDQWRNLPDNDMPKPVFNIIKRVISFQVASLTTSKIKIHFEPLTNADDGPDPNFQEDLDISDVANAQVNNLLEKFKFDFLTKTALTDGAITGDSCAHFYFDMTKKPYGGAFGDIKGEIEMDLVDGTNVFFGNANNPRVDVQPYIIISGRDTVENLKEEAKQYKSAQTDVDSITSDRSLDDQAGDSGKIEVEADEYGKALYIIVYRKDKKTGTIKVSKSVEKAYIYKDIDTGLENYPVAWFNWEKQKNQYHGRASCTGILPNQIFINRMFAMVMYHLMMTAFPKAVYNADMIETWDNEIGSAIPVHGADLNTPIKNIAGYLEPGNMSAQIVNVIDMAMANTKETLGISDASLGNIDPKNTSATIAVQKSSAIPLENPRSNLYEWIEDIGKILLDMMGTYYGFRPLVMEKNGQKMLKDYDFSQMKNVWLNVRADVGEASYWSEIAAVQTLDNLLANGHIDIINYLERVPDEYIPQKAELIAQLEQNMQMQAQQQQEQSMMEQQQQAQAQQDQQQQQMAEQQQQMMAQQEAESKAQAEKEAKQPHPFDQLLAKLPKHVQDEFKKMDPEQQQRIMERIMNPPSQ
ncbi:hypothetical protein LRR81_08715 [Metabacillus sp. GX 13764]|uniref:portal protein n=1 Tax=Metabacillus kandeliae TaxID=2900151 RepID=UPI001E642DE3|nr:hypothetical protein [Metabacillus kandeliae]MCD7034315.1 hypothetical protein [Metabacillus kandeliae]